MYFDGARDIRPKNVEGRRMKSQKFSKIYRYFAGFSLCIVMKKNLFFLTSTAATTLHNSHYWLFSLLVGNVFSGAASPSECIVSLLINAKTTVWYTFETSVRCYGYSLVSKRGTHLWREFWCPNVCSTSNFLSSNTNSLNSLTIFDVVIAFGQPLRR